MDILKYHLDEANWLELSTNYYAIDILKNNIVRRKIDPKFIHVKSTETASGNRVRQFIDILNGISKEDAKKITPDPYYERKGKPNI